MLLPSMAYTQNTEKENEFTMSMQIRPRAEYRNGALTPRDEGVAPTSFINNRARLSMDYKRSDLELKMSAQHVGVWGQDPQIEKNGRFMLNEAWAKLNFGEGFFAQLGRQSLIYDDERISNDVQKETEHQIEKIDLVFSGTCKNCLKTKN